eukprot:3354756-Prymnesium_polylepis.2
MHRVSESPCTPGAARHAAGNGVSQSKAGPSLLTHRTLRIDTSSSRAASSVHMIEAIFQARVLPNVLLHAIHADSCDTEHLKRGSQPRYISVDRRKPVQKLASAEEVIKRDLQSDRVRTCARRHNAHFKRLPRIGRRGIEGCKAIGLAPTEGVQPILREFFGALCSLVFGPANAATGPLMAASTSVGCKCNRSREQPD